MMRIRLLTFSVMVLYLTWGGVARAQSSGYNEGNTLYRQGAYQQAIDRYEAVVATGLAHPDVYYNLGNAYFKSGQLGRAALNYERARRLAPGDPDVLANIDFVASTKVDRFDVDPPNAVTRFFTAFYRMMTPNLLSVWIMAAVAVGSLAAGLWLFSCDRRLLWIVVLSCSLFCGLTAGALLAVKVQELAAPEGIILATEVMGRSGPGNDYLQIFTLHEATKVVIERSEGHWYLVRLPNGIGGWIASSSVERI